jgi:hypothetical protein
MYLVERRMSVRDAGSYPSYSCVGQCISASGRVITASLLATQKSHSLPMSLALTAASRARRLYRMPARYYSGRARFRSTPATGAAVRLFFRCSENLSLYQSLAPDSSLNGCGVPPALEILTLYQCLAGTAASTAVAFRPHWKFSPFTNVWRGTACINGRGVPPALEILTLYQCLAGTAAARMNPSSGPPSLCRCRVESTSSNPKRPL